MFVTISGLIQFWMSLIEMVFPEKLDFEVFRILYHAMNPVLRQKLTDINHSEMIFRTVVLLLGRKSNTWSPLKRYVSEISYKSISIHTNF